MITSMLSPQNAPFVTLILMLGILSVPQSAEAHPFHVSIAEAEWNPGSSRFEVALKVAPHELEQALRQATGRRLSLDDRKETERPLQRYVREHFVIEDRDGKRQPLIWIGYEISIKEAWMYFEVKAPKSWEQLRVKNRLLFEIESQQINTVNFRIGKDRRSISCSWDHPTKTLRKT